MIHARKTLVAIALILAAGHAMAAKPCEELKTEIAAQLDAKGVKHYTLDIIGKDDATDQKVVGSCGGGTKKIVYKRD